MSIALYDRSLTSGRDLTVHFGDGQAASLGLSRWHGAARGADASLLDAIDGPALDIGCGPGRIVAALAARGCPALGIDVAPAAVRLARRAGGRALLRSVFGHVPGAGTWAFAVLADGNIGIGGDPERLLRRTAELVRPDGRVLLELDQPGSGLRLRQAQLRDDRGATGRWFPWASVGVEALDKLATGAGLVVVETWSAHDDEDDGGGRRWFAALARG